MPNDHPPKQLTEAEILEKLISSEVPQTHQK
jgi:hypothetical protein